MQHSSQHSSSQHASSQHAVTQRSRRRLPLGVVAATFGLTASLLAPERARAQEAEPARDTTSAISPISESVMTTLAAMAGSNIVAIPSAGGECTLPGGQAVAWTKDLVILRTTLTNSQAVNAVEQALKAANITGKSVSAERVGFGDAGPGATPIVAVKLSSVSPKRIADLARMLLNKGIDAAPDYVLSPSPGSIFWWPNGNPKPATALETPRAPGSIAAGSRIFLYDTGLAPPSKALLPTNVVKFEANDSEKVDSKLPAGIADFYYSGHTVAISGVIKTIAPGATVYSARITNDVTGIATDFSAAKEMARTLHIAKNTGKWPHVIVTPFGSPGCERYRRAPGTEIVPLGLKAIAEVVRRHSTSLIVASAGNRATSRRFYPAAFTGVLAVGALDTTRDSDGSVWSAKNRSGVRASFSNFGTWVDAWAPGVGLNTNHLNGLKFVDTGPTLRGMALVDGTSFSAPYTAALIVEVMRRDGINALQAWAKVAASSKKCAAAAGSGVAVALVAKDAKADKPSSLAVTC